MLKALLIFIVAFLATSNAIRLNRFRQLGGNNQAIDTSKPKFCSRYDCPAYTVVSSTQEYELRKYAESNWITNYVEDTTVKSSPTFMKLFSYFLGANTAEQKMDMTVPVVRRFTPGYNNISRSFFIAPSVGVPPQPNDPELFVETVPELQVYVRVYDGFSKKNEAYKKHAAALRDALKKDGLTFEEGFYLTAGYSSPWKLSNRHNEIWVLKKYIP